MSRFLRFLLIGLLFSRGVAFGQNPKPSGASSVTLENVLTKLKLKGRAALGYLKSQDFGSFRSGSFEAPDVKLVFGFKPDETLDLVVRFNLNNAAANSPFADYVFLQAKDFISHLKETPWSVSGRLGRFKLGAGEETWSNNPIEGSLPSNSAANVDGADEGIEFFGKFWVVSLSNGQRGLNSETGQAKAWMGKIFYAVWNPLYASVTYYDSGSLKASQSEVSIAGIVAAPTGATNWKRRVWEADLRFDFEKGTTRDPPVFSDSKSIVRVSYGQFDDSVTGGAERNGHFGFIDVLYNCTSKIYGAARVSFIDLDGSQTASLNTVTTNHYERYSVGIGYRWSENTHVRLGYDHNENGGAGTSDVRDDLLSALLSLRF